MTSQRRGIGSRVLPPTPRDQEILSSVARHGQMTREQIREQHFRHESGTASVQAACRRLKALTDRGYLRRTRLPAAAGSGPYVYRLGPLASAVLPDAKLPSRRHRRVESEAGIAHALEVVDFYTALQTGVTAQNGDLATWLGEEEVRYTFSAGGRNVCLAPDAYCLWALDHEEGAFFLEWDRGTESMTRLADKLARYDAYYALRTYHAHLGEIGLRPRIVFVVPDERRAGKVARWLDSQQARGEFSNLPTVLVGAWPTVRQDILGAVWHGSRGDDPVSFAD